MSPLGATPRCICMLQSRTTGVVTTSRASLARLVALENLLHYNGATSRSYLLVCHSTLRMKSGLRTGAPFGAPGTDAKRHPNARPQRTLVTPALLTALIRVHCAAARGRRFRHATINQPVRLEKSGHEHNGRWSDSALSCDINAMNRVTPLRPRAVVKSVQLEAEAAWGQGCERSAFSLQCSCNRHASWAQYAVLKLWFPESVAARPEQVRGVLVVETASLLARIVPADWRAIAVLKLLLVVVP